MMRTLSASVLVCATLLLLFPFISSAQGADLRIAIYEALAEDPTVRDLSAEETVQLVEALALEAESRGITAADFLELSAENAVFDEEETSVCTYPAFICAMNEAFGFSGDDMRLPITLGAAAGALVLILGLILTRRHHHERIVGGGTPPPSAGAV